MVYVIANKTAVPILVTIRATETKNTFIIIFGPEDDKKSFLTHSKIPPKAIRAFDFMDKNSDFVVYDRLGLIFGGNKTTYTKNVGELTVPLWVDSAGDPWLIISDFKQ